MSKKLMHGDELQGQRLSVTAITPRFAINSIHWLVRSPRLW